MKNSIVLVVSGILAHFVNLAQAATLADAKILTLAGTATVHSVEDQKSKKTLKVGDVIRQGDVVTTGAKDSAKIAFSNGCIINLDPSTQVVLEVVAQEPHQSPRSYQQLVRDPSHSVTLLNINYGSVFGQVKKLTDNSKFNVKTRLGVVVLDDTRFRASYNFNPIANDFNFMINNIDGSVDVIAAYEGSNIYHGKQKTAKIHLSTNPDATAKIPVPQGYTIVLIRLHSKRNPDFQMML